MTTNKRPERKRQKKRNERIGRNRGAVTGQQSRLTHPEAEIIFVIWQSNRPIDNEDIADEHFKYFRPRVKKSEATVRGVINRIKKRERTSRRKYILSSEERPHTHEIAREDCVHSQGTAVMLLELKKGYLEYENSLVEILRAPFEQYINRKYPAKSFDLFKGPQDIAKRLRLADAKGFAKFKRYATSAGVEANSRLDIDLPYLLLVVDDYLKDVEKRSAAAQSKQLISDLRKLILLFGHSAYRNIRARLVPKETTNNGI